MAGVFPQSDWLESFENYLNSNEKYARVAKKWEGDLVFEIEAEGALQENVKIYLDLWHGKCRKSSIVKDGDPLEADFVLSAPFSNFVRVLKGDLDPMQAMLTRKLIVKGNLGYLMRNVPTVLEFVRCAQAVTDKVLGE